MWNGFVEKRINLRYVIFLVICLLWWSASKACSVLYFISGTPLPNYWSDNYKYIPTKIYQLEGDSLIDMGHIYNQEEYSLLDITYNYNSNVISVLTININEKSDRFEQVDVSFFTPDNLSVTHIKYEGLYNNDCIFLTHNQLYKAVRVEGEKKIKGINIKTRKDTVFIPNRDCKYMFEKSSYGSFKNVPISVLSSDVKTILPCDILNNDVTIDICILDTFQIVYTLPYLQEEVSTVFSYYNLHNDSCGKFTVNGQKSRINAFGTWLVGCEYYSKKEMGLYLDSPGKNIRDSIWNNDWYSNTQRCQFDDYSNYGLRGYTADDRFKDLQIYSSGVLFLFNTTTGTFLTINTGQGDSQILLLEDDEVYYRVNDSIYVRRIINGSHLSDEKLIIKSPNIVDVHWAFSKK